MYPTAGSILKDSQGKEEEPVLYPLRWSDIRDTLFPLFLPLSLKYVF